MFHDPQKNFHYLLKNYVGLLCTQISYYCIVDTQDFKNIRDCTAHMGEYRQVLFYASVILLKKSQKSNTKFPFKTGVRGLTMLSYIVNDYTTSGHTYL